MSDTQTASNLFEIIQQVGGSLKHSLITKHLGDIAASSPDDVLDVVVGDLVSSRDYESLLKLWDSASRVGAERGNVVFDRYLNAPLDRRAFAKHLLDKERGERVSMDGRYILRLLDNSEGTDDLMARLTTNHNFVMYHPVTCLGRNLKIQNYGGIAKAVVEIVWNQSKLDHGSDVDRDNELRDVRTMALDVDGLRVFFEKSNAYHASLSHLYRGTRGESPTDEEYALLHRSRENLRHAMIAKVKVMINASEDPKRAYEAVGDAFMKHKWEQRNIFRQNEIEHYEGAYGHAITFYVLSENLEKIYEACKMAQKHGRGMGNIFDGFKAIFTQTSGLSRLHRRSKQELVTISTNLDDSKYSTEQRFEAAELIGDFSGLRKGFYNGIMNKSEPCTEVYQRLKSEGEIDDEKIRAAIIGSLRTINERSSTLALQWLIQYADLAGLQIPRKNIIGAMERVGMNKEVATAGFEYLGRTEQMTDQDRISYEAVKLL